MSKRSEYKNLLQIMLLDLYQARKMGFLTPAAHGSAKDALISKERLPEQVVDALLDLKAARDGGEEKRGSRSAAPAAPEPAPTAPPPPPRASAPATASQPSLRRQISSPVQAAQRELAAKERLKRAPQPPIYAEASTTVHFQFGPGKPRVSRRFDASRDAVGLLFDFVDTHRFAQHRAAAARAGGGGRGGGGAPKAARGRRSSMMVAPGKSVAFGEGPLFSYTLASRAAPKRTFARGGADGGQTLADVGMAAVAILDVEEAVWSESDSDSESEEEVGGGTQRNWLDDMIESEEQ